jgi:hypothetical protein
MKSIAAYYVLVAMNTQQQHADPRRAKAAARPSRPSLVARARALLTSGRSTQPAGTAA